MRLSDFDFHLPAERIAQRPLAQRDASRMLILNRANESWEDAAFAAFPDRLRGDELIVVNNARVIPARLFGRRLGIRAETPGKNRRAAQEFLSSEIEVLLTRQVYADEWEALVRPGKKMRVGERVEFGEGELSAEVLDRGEYGLRRIRLTAQGDLNQAIERLGHIPLPPYIAREDEPADRERYQTIFADRPGAVAAPTAGCIFLRQYWKNCGSAKSKWLPSRWTWASERFSPFTRKRSSGTKSTPSATKYLRMPRTQFAARGAMAVPSWPWAPRWCALWRTPRRNRPGATAALAARRRWFKPGWPKPKFSSSPGTHSARSINSSPMSICRNPRCLSWSARLPGANRSCAPTGMPWKPNIVFTATAIACGSARFAPPGKIR